MKTILLQIKPDSVNAANTVTEITTVHNICFWLTVIEFLIIVFLLLKMNKKSRNLTFSELNKGDLKKSKETNIDMDNLMASINNSRELYKELSSKCHPDRFVNSSKQNAAEDIFQEISLNKRNHEKLLALKERAINELDLTF